MLKRVLLLCFLLLTGTARAALPTWGYEVVHSYPHDPKAFTQGLIFRNGFLYESTGLEGRSSVRKVKLESGEVLQKVDLPPEVFGEGIVDWGDTIVGITWRSQAGFVLRLDNFKFERQFSYVGEGWGITKNEQELVMSDGTPELRFLDPKSFKELRRLKVAAEGKPVERLNELEWVDGEIWANIWMSDRIARIDPKTGRVLGWIDLRGLLSPMFRLDPKEAVLNGIAYDPATKRIFVTGKLWPRLFQIRLVK